MSEQRKYSVGEIDAMRESIRWSYPCGVPYTPSERSAEIEERLRTYMLNGTSPEELHERASQRIRAEAQRIDAKWPPQTAFDQR